VADTDTHASRPGSDLAGDLYVRQGGLTAVFAPCLDRASLFAALRSRRCYATSGQRIILRFRVDNAFMGETLRLEDSVAPRAVNFSVEGTDALASVSVVKNNETVHHEAPGDASLSSVYTDRTPAGDGDFYYLRVVQADGEMAWSSPVWVSIS
jgi:hypothetical protein